MKVKLINDIFQTVYIKMKSETLIQSSCGHGTKRGSLFRLLLVFMMCVLKADCFPSNIYNISTAITAKCLVKNDNSILIGYQNHVTHIAYNMTSLKTDDVGVAGVYVEKLFQRTWEENEVTSISVLALGRRDAEVLVCVELGEDRCRVLDLKRNTTYNVTGEIHQYGGSQIVTSNGSERYITSSRDVNLTRKLLNHERAYLFSVHNMTQTDDQNYRTDLVESFKPHVNVDIRVIYSFQAHDRSYFVTSYTSHVKTRHYAIHVMYNYFYPGGIKLLEMPIHVGKGFELIKANLLESNTKEPILYLLCHNSNSLATVVMHVTMTTLEQRRKKVYRDYVERKSGFFPHWLSTQSLKYPLAVSYTRVNTWTDS